MDKKENQYLTTVHFINTFADAGVHYRKILDSIQCGEAIFAGIEAIIAKLEINTDEQRDLSQPLTEQFDLLFDYAARSYKKVEDCMSISYQEQMQLYLENLKIAEAPEVPLNFTYSEEIGRRIFRNLEDFEHSLEDLCSEIHIRPGKLDGQLCQDIAENANEVCDSNHSLLLILAYCELRALAHQIELLKSANETERDLLGQKVQQSQQEVADQIKTINSNRYGAISPELARYITMDWLEMLNHHGYIMNQCARASASQKQETARQWLERNYADVLVGKFQNRLTTVYWDMIDLTQVSKIRAITNSYTTVPESKILLRLWEITCGFWQKELGVIPIEKAYAPLEVTQIMQQCFNCRYPDWTFQIDDNQFKDGISINYSEKSFCIPICDIPEEFIDHPNLEQIICALVLLPATLLIDYYQSRGARSPINGYEIKATQALLESACFGKLYPPRSMQYLAVSWGYFNHLSCKEIRQALQMSSMFTDGSPYPDSYTARQIATVTFHLTGDLVNHRCVASTNDFLSKWHFVVEHINEPEVIIDALFRYDDISDDSSI